MTPQISITIPVFNREQFVAQAIQSVLAQTRRDFELLVWDDGSTDNSVAVATEAAAGDPRVRIVTAEHLGEAAARKSAIEQTTGTYMGWVDSDDALGPTALQDTAAVLDANPSVGVVYTDYLVMNEAGQIKGPGQRTRKPYSKEGLLVDFMTFHFRLMRRSVFDAAGGIQNLSPRCIDYDLCLRLSEITDFRHLAKPLYLYRVHPKSVSQEGQYQQIMDSASAVTRALERRGLAKDYELDVEINGAFMLRPIV